MHNYYNMHDTVIMHGCIIVFMLDYLIIQQGGLFKKRPIIINTDSDEKCHLLDTLRNVFHVFGMIVNYFVFWLVSLGFFNRPFFKEAPLLNN